MRTAKTTGKALTSVVFAGLLVLSLASCAPEGGGPEPTVTAGNSAAQEAEAAPEPLTGAECIVGTWLLDNAEFAGLISNVGAQFVDEITGVARFSAFADGTAQTEYIEWKHYMSMADVDGTIVMTRNGIDTAVYAEAGDNTFDLQEDGFGAIVNVKMVSGDSVISDTTVESSPGIMEMALFTCIGDELTGRVDDHATVLTRES